MLVIVIIKKSIPNEIYSFLSNWDESAYLNEDNWFLKIFYSEFQICKCSREYQISTQEVKIN